MTSLGTNRTLFAPLTLALAAVLTLGCDATDSPLQGELNQKKTERYAEAASKIDEVESERLAAGKATLPDPKAEAPAGGKGPLVTWRTGIAAPETKTEGTESSNAFTSQRTALEQVQKTYKGTPAELAATFGLGFLQASNDYWTTGKSMTRYYRFLEAYLRDAEKELKDNADNAEFKGRPFTEEARFDRIFLHAARWMKMQNSGASLTTIFSQWQLAFDYPAKSREGFSKYITRLCLASPIADTCKNVVHELRPIAVNKPYMEWAKKESEAFVATAKDEALKDVAGRFISQLDVALKAVPDFTEDPVLPASFSPQAASGGLSLLMSEKTGVRLHRTAVAESFKGSLPKGFADTAKQQIETLKNTPGNTVDFERVVLEMPGSLSASTLGKVIRSFPSETVRQFDLVGRRRVDNSLRRTGLLVRRPAPDEPPETSYMSQAGKKTRCGYMGIVGKSAIGRKSPGSYLIYKKDRVQGVKLSRDPESKEIVVGETTLDVKPTETDAVAKWADDNEGIVRFFLDGKAFSYDEAIQVMSSIVYKCEDMQVNLDEMGAKKLTVPCGKAKKRDITLVFGLCS